ncbi:Uncharacterised protein [Candidatus Burarchaeum australiense]|nr:Uncharacterised protein [Candidatus Burarchaeum australiense]
MEIKDKVVSFYIKKYLIPRSQIIDQPGFITFNLMGKTPVFARQIIMPEVFFNELEHSASLQGSTGKQRLYAVGKKFGYRFALMGNFYARGQIPDTKLIEHLNVVNKFIEGTYASEISARVDLKGPVITYKIKNFVVISNIGFGYFLPLGAAAGLLSRIFNDSTINGRVIKSARQGSELLYAPYDLLKKRGVAEFEENDLSDLEVEADYRTFNSLQKLTKINYSFKNMIDAGLLSYNQGIIRGGEYRYFILEVSALYLLEKELEKNKKMSEALYAAAYKAGVGLIRIKENMILEDAANILTAFGFGEVSILSKKNCYEVEITGYPWTKYYKQTTYPIIRGLVSGFLSELLKKKIEFRTVETDVSENRLSILLQQ